MLILIAGFFSYGYLFNIYEVSFRINPERLYADNRSISTIEAVPINSLGIRAPFRKSPIEFTITEGAELIKINFIDKVKGIIQIRAKDKPGKVSITIKPKYSIFPSTIEIIIEPNLACS